MCSSDLTSKMKAVLCVFALVSFAAAIPMTPVVLNNMLATQGFEVAVKGKFFLGNFEALTLNPCAECAAGEEVVAECTLTKNTICGPPGSGSGAGWNSKSAGGNIQMFRPTYTHSPATADFNENKLSKPIVMLSPPTRNGGDPSVVRMQKTETNVKVAIIESPNNDFPHTTENTDILVFEQESRYDDKLYFGTVEAAGEWVEITFPNMGANPKVFCTIQTDNNDASFTGSRTGSKPYGFAMPQVKDIGATSALVRVATDQNGGRAVETETVGFMVVGEESGSVRGLEFRTGSVDAPGGLGDRTFNTGLSMQRAVLMQPVSQNSDTPIEIREYNSYNQPPTYHYTLEAAAGSAAPKGETVHWFAIQRGDVL